MITAKLVDVSNKTGDFGPEASGAVGLVRTDSNRFYGMRGRAERAHSAALILCEADRPPGLLPRRQFDSAPKPQGMTFPILWVEPACFEELAKAASAGGSVRIGITSESRPEAVGFNIAGATGDPSAKKVIVVCAHRDAMGQLADGTTFPGAIDNASGTATLIELARVLSKSSPDKAFVFLSTDSEESYMEGATFFATHLPFRTENLAAVVNLGCIGVLGEDKGYPAISILASRDYFVRYHTPTDTVDALDIGELATVVEALTRALTEP